MKMRMKIKIVFTSHFLAGAYALALTLALNSQAFAHGEEGHHNENPKRKPKLIATQGNKQCRALGLKNFGEYLLTKDLRCFKNKKRAEAQGFGDATQGLLKVPTLHPVTVSLSGANTVPPAATQATGSCTGIMDHSNLKVRIACSHSIPMPDPAFVGHIHLGAPGQSGLMICASPHASSLVAFECQLNASTHHALHAGELYINLHSTNFPDGELRGQIEVP